LCGEESGGQRIALRSIRRDEANFVHPNVGHIRERRLQLLGQDGRLRIACGKGAHQPFEILFRDARSELDAGEACGRKQRCIDLARFDSLQPGSDIASKRHDPKVRVCKLGTTLEAAAASLHAP